jgi:hypothetical protein
MMNEHITDGCWCCAADRATGYQCEREAGHDGPHEGGDVVFVGNSPGKQVENAVLRAFEAIGTSPVTIEDLQEVIEPRYQRPRHIIEAHARNLEREGFFDIFELPPLQFTIIEPPPHELHFAELLEASRQWWLDLVMVPRKWLGLMALVLLGCAPEDAPNGVLWMDVCPSVSDAQFKELVEAVGELETRGCHPPVVSRRRDRCEAPPTRNKVQVRTCSDLIAPFDGEGCRGDLVQWDAELWGTGVAYWSEVDIYDAADVVEATTGYPAVCR